MVSVSFPFRTFLPIYNWIYPLTAKPSAEFQGQKRSNVFSVIGAAQPTSRALYIHVPFCETICSFCPFVRGSYSSDEVIELYTRALIEEIKYKSALIGHEVPIGAIFFGGGTPSLLNPDQILQIGSAIRAHFNLSRLREFSFEFEVKSVTASKIDALLEIGVSHARFGLQTFNPKYRELFALTATLDQVQDAATRLQASFNTTSCDLIYGMNGQTVDEFLLDLDSAVSLGLQNLDFYPINNAVTQTRLHRAYESLGLTPTSGSVKFYMNALLREVMKDRSFLPHNGHGYVRVPTTEISRDPVVTDKYRFVYHEHVYGCEGYDVVGFGVNAITSTTRFTLFNDSNRERYIRGLLEKKEWSFTVCEHEREVDALRPLALHLPYFGSVGSDCRIAKIDGVNIDVLRDDRFDPSADTIGCLSLLNPDRPEQLVNVAGLDLRNGKFSDCRVGVPFE